MARLVQHGWHPLWVLVFDEPWLLAARLRSILHGAVNTSQDFGLNWDWMAWYLDPTRQAFHPRRQQALPWPHVFGGMQERERLGAAS